MQNQPSLKTKALNIVKSLFTNSFAEQMLIKYSLGKSPRSLIGKLLPSHYLYEKGSNRIVNRKCLKFNLDISDLVDWYLYFGLKEDSHDVLYSLCKEDYIVMDVGTNIGAVMMQLSQKLIRDIFMASNPMLITIGNV
jgi:hypothetical protein